MVHLLHIDVSPRRNSFSREVSAVFASEWRTGHPGGDYTYRDLGADPLPPVDEARTEIAIQSSAAGIRELAGMPSVVRTPAQERSWAVSRPLIEEVLAADVLLIASPMYNFSLPSSLKAWIDQISFPWLPLAGRTAVVITARGGSYTPGTPRAAHDHQEPYLRAYFEILGLTDLHFIHTELTNALHIPFLAEFEDAHQTSRAAALKDAAALPTSIGQRLQSSS
ncbi:FMN-dependent NADH-azoreductase [Nocardia amikacinitolerans]|uniref:FMN-dependent NADH-azoreductase n=1 Tax=Nocardia amikacinitolerans TaxID=756689 RepID=UPI0020A45FFA|nr:NAD(P)H-dependent oxidoreductase [Nocardia amikacinitolerans]MCP2280948.1 FMN-dependent NADH-azoreductase [Nocardia amikacinitolerans]